jgi:hypothetical protein
MEKLTLSAPVSITDYQVDYISFSWSQATIKIIVLDTTGKATHVTYSGSIATTLMTQLNKVNLSTQSLHSRIIARLQADGHLPAGSITGSPD